MGSALFCQMVWTQATASAGWTPRCNHTSVVFNDKIWVIGGWDGSYKNDVWYSNDGVNWTCATSNAEWSGRYRHASVVYDNKIWVIGGGVSYNTFLRDVWYSTDGVSWTCATSSAPWADRQGLTAVVFDNKMWVLGGWSRYEYPPMPPLIYYYNDVWYSTNGINWTPATYNAEWQARYAHASVVFNNKIWVLGGNVRDNILNDVWYSTNGTQWVQAVSNAQWSTRAYHSSVAFDDKIWVLGGSGNGLQNNVWYSSDGSNWTQATPSANWTARDGHTSVVFDNKMWLIGGYDGNRKNDVWYSTGLTGMEEKSSLISTIHTSLKIVPNPASSFFIIRTQFSVAEVTIYNVTGKIIKVQKFNGSNVQKISLDGIKSGVYFVKVNDEMLKEKLVVTK